MNVKNDLDRQKMQRPNPKGYPPTGGSYPQGNNMPYQQPYPQ